MLEPSTPLEWNWHIEAIALHLQAILEDWDAKQHDPEVVQRIQNLVINIPPGTGKSRIVSVMCPSWAWTRWPAWRAIFMSANPRVATRDSVYCRIVLESEWYQDLFRPEWALESDQNAKTLYRNSAGGFRQAMGYGMKITGDRADALFNDDPNDTQEVFSLRKREGVNERWDTAISNRVNDLRSSVRIGIQQRCHDEDWSGHVLRQGGWSHLCLPMEFEPERAVTTPIGWSDPRTKAGEVLHPDRFPPAVLASERVRLGSAGYAGQMQQRPVPAGGNLFKSAWFDARYRSLPKLKEVFSIWDTALKDGQENDETAVAVWAIGENGNAYLLAVYSGRWETPEMARFLVSQAKYLRKLYGARYKGDFVEDKSSGTTLMQYVRRTDRELVLIGIRPDGDKSQRANGVTPLCEAGRVFLPELAVYPNAREWVEKTLHQVTTFPNAAHDDILDVFVYGLKRVLGTLKVTRSRRGKAGGMK